MRVEEAASTERVLELRERFVPRGVATTDLVVARASGGRIWDVEGREYLDFAGGIACQNLGHGRAAIVAAIHDQVDRYLHQCFMVGMYEPYVAVAERLDELWPGKAATKTLLVNSGAEAIENAVKIARAAAPYPYHGVSTEDALHGLELLFKQDVDPQEVACIVLEPVQGEGGFIPMTHEFVQALRELCDKHGIVYVDDEVQAGCGRTGPVWAIERFGVEPDLLVSGKTLGGGLPLAAVTGRRELLDAVQPGGLGGTFGGNPVACAAALAVLDELSAPGFRERADEIARLLRTRLEAIASRHPIVGEVRGLGAMLALELVEQSGDASRAVTTAARGKGLVLLSCGLYGNVIRLLPPLSATDEELERGLAILEEALGDAGSG